MEIPKFSTPESYEQYALNVQKRAPELAQEARRKAIELRAATHGAETDVEREAYEAVYAYERMLLIKHGKKVPAAYTWRMIRNRGIIPAVERLVMRKDETSGYRLLVANGLEDKAFESVVLRHPKEFSAEAVSASENRLKESKESD